MKRKIFNVQTLLYLALILALLSSLSHVAFAFATTNGNNQVEAYLSAVAIDIGMLGLAAGINIRKSQNRKTAVLWLGVLIFSIISTYANWLSGIVHVQQLTIKVEGFSNTLVNLRPILLSAVLPILVIYLSEIVSDNHEFARLTKQDEEIVNQNNIIAQEKVDIIENDKTESQIEQVNSERKAQKQIKLKQLESLLVNNPQLTIPELAEELQVSNSTIRNYKIELNGKVAK